MVTVGFDFGTHQTKVCYETVETGTTFYKVFQFATPDGKDELTLPSLVRIGTDGLLRYGYDAAVGNSDGRVISYFKQKMFSLSASDQIRNEAKQWAILYLAFILFKLDAHFSGRSYAIQMGMPTDAVQRNYDFCKRQAITAMVSAMLLARNVFHGDLNRFLITSHAQLAALVGKCMALLPDDIHEVQNQFPVLVFPEAYAALIPLINDHKLPKIGPNLFVDIGGGTIDISFFTNRMDGSIGYDRPCLYYFHSVPYGLNMITGQDINHSHNIKIGQSQITREGVDRFHANLLHAVDTMMGILCEKYTRMDRTNVMPFQSLCLQILNDRPICYSGGGSMFHGLRLPITQECGFNYGFTDVKTVSGLIDHSKLYVSDEMFHVLATAFALCHHTLINLNRKEGPDAIALVSVDWLFEGIRLPRLPNVRTCDLSVTRFGTVDLVKHDYTLDLQRAESGDLAAQQRIDEARANGNVPIGITIASKLAAECLKKKEAEKAAEQRRAQHIAEANRKLEEMMRMHKQRVEKAKQDFKAGDNGAAIRIATLLLQAPDFSVSRFDEARDWLNIAKERGLASMKLLALFASICRKGQIPNSKKHLQRYERIIGYCRCGRYNGIVFDDSGYDSAIGDIG